MRFVPSPFRLPVAALVPLLAALGLAGPDARAQDDPLAPVAFLVGEHRGEGKHPWGTYEERLVGTRILGGQAIEVRSRCEMKGQVVFEDLRVISHDPDSGTIRMRQWAMGDLAVYEAEVREGGQVVAFRPIAREGKSRKPWRYTFRRGGEDGFEYRVEEERDGKWHPYVSGELARRKAGPDEQGPLAVSEREVVVPVGKKQAVAARIYVPEGPGPFPAVVFSPGGAAASVEGYDAFGHRFASWGVLTVVVAFAVDAAEPRAELFGKVADWLTRKDAEPRVDAARLAAAGHSLGGHAAVLAALQDRRFVACLALAPSGPSAFPEKPPGTPLVGVVVGEEDDLAPVGRAVHDRFAKGGVFVVVRGMNHFFAPHEAGMAAMAHATAFLTSAIGGRAEHAAFLDRDDPAVEVRRGP
jgi:dienelactone hydrolase